MHWMLWVVVAWIAFSALSNVAQVGKERQPVTGGVAAAIVVVLGILCAFIIIGGHAHA